MTTDANKQNNTGPYIMYRRASNKYDNVAHNTRYIQFYVIAVDCLSNGATKSIYQLLQVAVGKNCLIGLVNQLLFTGLR